jgi:hypothetical protein
MQESRSDQAENDPILATACEATSEGGTSKVQTDGIAAKRRKKRKKENERKFTGGTEVFWQEGNHLLDIAMQPDKADYPTRSLSCLVQTSAPSFFLRSLRLFAAISASVLTFVPLRPCVRF